jgi:ABC-type transport system substrate-binding protein
VAPPFEWVCLSTCRIWTRHYTNGSDTLERVGSPGGLRQTLTPEASLADSFDFSSDALQLKLNLRKGVQCHIGRELTSDNVACNFNRLKTESLVQVTGYAALVARLHRWRLQTSTRSS